MTRLFALILAVLAGTTPAVPADVILDTDVMPTYYLNAPTLDCNGIPTTYYLQRTHVVYFNASIVCQLTTAYITYSRKAPYT
jgi:hypothetical protein